MARPASQIKLGYHPLSMEACDLLARHLTAPARPVILDPCCGDGAAIGRIGTAMGCKDSDIYGIELDEGRAAAARERLPAATILGPCSTFGARVRPASFGLAYVNPPFDDEYGGGGRQEINFVLNVLPWIAPRGVLAFVMPEDVFRDAGRLLDALDCCLDPCAVYRLPDRLRRYREVVGIGRVRATPLSLDDAPPVWGVRFAQDRPTLPVLGDDERRWRVPRGKAPGADFRKIDYTAAELRAAVETSPLNRLFEAPLPLPRPAPPLQLGRGHVSLFIAAGGMNGLIRPDDGPAHVVRGTSRKEKIIKESVTTTTDDGATERRDVIDDRPMTIVRTLEEDGTLRTFR